MGAGTQVLIDERKKLTVRRLRIEVRQGPDKGLELELDAEPVRIGSSSGCEVQLSDSAVSGLHAQLQRTPQGLLIRDLGSTNGTFVGDLRVQTASLEGTFTMRLGRSELKVSPLRHESPVELAADDRLGDLVGTSLAMRALFAKLKRVAASDTTVLLTGETGTGKELVAAAIHEHSRAQRGAVRRLRLRRGAREPDRERAVRARARRVHRRRSHPPGRLRAGPRRHHLPRRDRRAAARAAARPARRARAARSARASAARPPIEVDVRVIAATNRDLAAEVARGAFRDDLYYRLAVIEIRLPPLRERPEDIPLLVEHMLNELAGERPTISPETLEQLKGYPWPGNVRELRNVIERAALLAEPPQLRRSTAAATTGATTASFTVDIEQPFKDQKNAIIGSFERAYIEQLLAATQGNITAAARKAGIDRMYLYKLVDRYRIDLPARGKLSP